MKKNYGFTFIELLIVMVIIVILISLSIPAVINYQRSQAEDEEIKNFISTLRSTQNLALTTDISYSITFQDSQVTICPFNSTQCRKITNDFIRSSVSKINIDRYGNLVNDNNSLVSFDTITFFSTNSASKKIFINKVGRINYVDSSR